MISLEGVVDNGDESRCLIPQNAELRHLFGSNAGKWQNRDTIVDISVSGHSARGQWCEYQLLSDKNDTLPNHILMHITERRDDA